MMYLKEFCLGEIPSQIMSFERELNAGQHELDFISSQCVIGMLFCDFSAIGFVEHLNLFCGALSEYCSVLTCPSMLVPGNK